MCRDMLGVVVSTVLTLCVLDVLADVVELVVGVAQRDAVCQELTVAEPASVAVAAAVISPEAVATIVALPTPVELPK